MKPLRSIALIAVLLLAYACPARAEVFRFEPASFSMEIPEGWIVIPEDAVAPSVYYEAREGGDLDELLEVGLVIGSFAGKTLTGGLARLRLVLGASPGALPPDQIDGMRSEIELILAQTLRKFIALEYHTSRQGEYDLCTLCGRYVREGKPMELHYAVLWDAEHSYKLMASYQVEDSGEVSMITKDIIASIKAGPAPSGRSPISKALGVISLGLALVLVIIVASRLRRKPTAAAVISAVFGLLAAFMPSSAFAEQGASLSFSLPESCFVEDEEGFESFFEGGLSEFIPPEHKPYTMIAVPDVSEEDPDYDFYHVFLHPLTSRNSGTVDKEVFLAEYVAFNKFESYDRRSLELMSDASFSFFSARLTVHAGEKRIETLVLARPYMFGWMVLEVMAPAQFIERNYGALIRSMMALQVHQPETLMPVGSPFEDFRLWAVAAIAIAAIVAVIVAIVRKHRAKAVAALLLVGMTLCIAADTPDTAFLSSKWTATKNEIPGMIAAYVAMAPGASTVSTFSGENGGKLVAVELWDRPGAFLNLKYQGNGVAWTDSDLKGVSLGKFSESGDIWGVALVDNGAARTFCLAAYSTDPISDIRAELQNFKSKRKPVDAFMVFLALAVGVVVIAWYYRTRRGKDEQDPQQ